MLTSVSGVDVLGPTVSVNTSVGSRGVGDNVGPIEVLGAFRRTLSHRTC